MVGGASAFVVEKYGTGDMFFKALNATVAIINGDIITYILSVVLASGVLTLLFTAAEKDNPAKSIRWGLTAIITIGLLIGKKESVQIIDHLKPTTGGVHTVDNVPLFLALSLALTNQLGGKLTNKFETALSPVGYPTMEKYGSVFYGKLMSKMGSIRITDPTLKTNMMRFCQQCILTHAGSGKHFTAHDLKTSKNIWGLVKEKMPNDVLGFFWQEKGSNTPEKFVGCKSAVKKFDEIWKGGANTESIFREASNKILSKGKEVRAGELIKGYFENTNLPKTLDSMGSGAIDRLQQAVMVNAINESSRERLGYLNPGFSIAQAETNEKYKNASALKASWFVEFAPQSRDVLELILICVFPLVMLSMMLPIGGTILKNYIGAFVLLEFTWGPVMAIINMLTTYMVAEIDGYTLATSEAVISNAENVLAMANNAFMSVTVIGFALLTGGTSMFQFLGNMTAAGSAGIDATASSMTSGNYSYGNVNVRNRSFNNANGNKFNTSSAFESNNSSFVDENGVRITNFSGGKEVVNSSAGISNFATTINSGRGYQNFLSSTSDFTRSQGASISQDYSRAWSNLISQKMDFAERMSSDASFRESWLNNVSDDRKQTYENILARVKSSSDSSSGSDSRSAGLGFKSVTEGSVGVDFFGNGSKTTLSGSASGDVNTDIKNSSSVSDGVDNRKQYMETINELWHMAQSENIDESFAEGKSYQNSITKSEEKVNSLREAMSINQAQQMKLNEAISQSQSSSHKFDLNLSQQMYEFAKEYEFQPGQKIGGRSAIAYLNSNSERGNEIRDAFWNKYGQQYADSMLNPAKIQKEMASNFRSGVDNMKQHPVANIKVSQIGSDAEGSFSSGIAELSNKSDKFREKMDAKKQYVQENMNHQSNSIITDKDKLEAENKAFGKKVEEKSSGMINHVMAKFKD